MPRDLEAYCADVLEAEGPLFWDDLVAELESDMETALESLQDEDRVVYDSDAGYRLEAELDVDGEVTTEDLRADVE